MQDPVQHQRSKHIELHMHFIRKLIHDHVLEVQYCSTDDQVADIFTKALTEEKFTKLRFMVEVQEVVTKASMLVIFYVIFTWKTVSQPLLPFSLESNCQSLVLLLKLMLPYTVNL